MDFEINRAAPDIADAEGAELRYDLFRGKWVLVSEARGHRPSEFARRSDRAAYDPDNDPFLDPVESGQYPDTLIYRDEDDAWTTRVFPNKFPAVDDAQQSDSSEGPYPGVTATGQHEVVVTRDGRRTFALLETMELAEVIDAYQDRYVAMMSRRDTRSITIFHNHGPSAGGSVLHPHSQILSLPVVSHVVMHEILMCERYRTQADLNLFAVIAEYERERGTRVVYENEDFLVYCPYAPSRAFEMRILPRRPQPYFERITDSQKIALADALGTALRSLYYGLEDPDFNYYIRTAPCSGQDYPDFSYYVEIFPRTHVFAGFESATDIDIVPVLPEKAAAFLRETLHENDLI